MRNGGGLEEEQRKGAYVSRPSSAQKRVGDHTLVEPSDLTKFSVLGILAFLFKRKH